MRYANNAPPLGVNINVGVPMGAGAYSASPSQDEKGEKVELSGRRGARRWIYIVNLWKRRASGATGSTHLLENEMDAEVVTQ